MKNLKNVSNIEGTASQDDPVFKQYGPPFIVSDKGKVHLNERAIAVKCATEELLKYDPNRKVYEGFDRGRGLWTQRQDSEVHRTVGDLLLRLGKEYEQDEIVQRTKTSHINSIAKMLKPYQAEVELKEADGLVHVRNGVLDLRGNEPKLLKHDPTFAIRTSSEIQYDPKAKCPRFLSQLLEPALAREDIVLVQKYCGSMLLGGNTCHGMLIVRGTPGGGKSTVVTIVEKVIGETKVAQLLTKHLSGRFESSAFVGKRLLVGKDVPGDTLAEKGARMLKSLVGGDLLQAEIKYNPTKRMFRGDFHVIIASNSNLRIALDGDEAAWERRLLVVDFEKERPTKPIADLAQKLFDEEGSGILNWLVQGALAYRKEMKKGKLTLTAAQQERVTKLIQDSDSVRAFVDSKLTDKKGGDVSSDELLQTYYLECKHQKWTPVGTHAFQTRLPDMMLTRFTVHRRNDIIREGKAVRGFKHVALTK